MTLWLGTSSKPCTEPHKIVFSGRMINRELEHLVEVCEIMQPKHPKTIKT